VKARLLGREPGEFKSRMPTHFKQQVRQIARGPEGRRIAEEAKRLARDPRMHARIDEARKRLAGHRRKPAA
jgi:hypothetical protein